MNKKEQYEAPLVECYEIKMEKRPLMASPDYKRGGGGTYTPDEINDNGEYV